MGCRDSESNFQYTFFNPKDGKWWCTHGYTPVYAAPKGYENILAEYVKKRYLPHVRFRARFNSKGQVWEVRPILDHANGHTYDRT